MLSGYTEYERCKIRYVNWQDVSKLQYSSKLNATVTKRQLKIHVSVCINFNPFASVFFSFQQRTPISWICTDYRTTTLSLFVFMHILLRSIYVQSMASELLLRLSGCINSIFCLMWCHVHTLCSWNTVINSKDPAPEDWSWKAYFQQAKVSS